MSVHDTDIHEKEYRIEINFDLSMQALDDFFPGGRDNRSEAYKKIEKYLLSNNFEHALLSGYVSLDLYTDKDIPHFVNNFFDSDSWIENCMQVCHITVVKDEIIDALELRKIAKNALSIDKENIDFQYERTTSLEDRLRLLEKQRKMYLQKAEKCEKEIAHIKNMEIRR